MSDWLKAESYHSDETMTIVFKAREDRKELNFNRSKKKMFEDIYREAYEKLSKEVKDFVVNMVLNNVRKPRGYFNGIIDSCAPILELVRTSSKELNEALDREAEKVAAYYEAERTADNSSNEQH